MPNVGSPYVVVRARTTKLKGDMNDAHRMVDDTMNKINSVFKVAAVAGAAAFVVMSKSILSLGLDFESTMKTVQAWSGATGESLQALIDIAREMGATTEWSANQSAEALKFLAAAGFTVEQSIAALPQTLDLATAGQVDLASASDITTDVLTAFGMEVEELGRINNAFITTASSSNTNVLMLGQSFKMVAPTAKLFGLSVEKTAAFLGTLANAGVKAEMAGSGLNMVLLRSTKAAKMLGVDALTPLVDILKMMKEEEWDATQIGEAFGARQVKTAAILMDNIGTYESLTKKIVENKTATQDLAAIIRDSLGVEIKELKSIIEEQMLVVFDKIKPSLREIVTGMTDWISKNDELIKQEIHKAIDKIVTATTATWDVLTKLKTFYDNLPEGTVGVGLIG
ncbi:hypothetical protein LCGC14_1815880, partial [marine sediment metagenome]